MSTALSSSMSRAPLVRRLTDLGLASSKPSKRVFANRLADLIDISDAITLADFFSSLDGIRASGEFAETYPADTLFAQHRTAMRRSIDASFVTDEDDPLAADSTAFPLPKAKKASLGSPEATARYQRFYSLHQSELERRVAQLRKAMLERLQAESDALAQVAAVEAALGPVFVKYSRRCLAVLPRLVAKRFEQVRLQQFPRERMADAPELPFEDSDWLANFHNELQQLLHAELALRLQPLEGMLSCLPPENPTRENP